MASSSRLPPKKDVALALLEQSTVFVHLDPRNDAVRVPPWFKKQPQLVLQIGLNMAIPIPDLEVGEDGISCTLSFSRSPHFCWIPWTSVFALVGDNGRGMVWPDDVPREVAAQAGQQQQRPERAPALHAVPNKTPARTSEAKEEKPKKKRARKPAVAKEATPKRVPKAEGRTAAARPAAAAKPAAAPAPTPAPARGATATGGTASGSSAAGDKRRRALPPYLRVIK